MAPSSLNHGSSFMGSTASPSPTKVTKRSRKFTALRAPPKSSAHPNVTRNIPRIHVTFPGSAHSEDFPPHLRELMMALTNDRYPGAPGTALAKAREASEREATRIRRERKRLADRQEELERLGVVVPGVSKNGSGPAQTNGKERRTRKGTPQSVTASTAGARSASPGGGGTVRETRKSNGSRRTPNLGADSDTQQAVLINGHEVGSSTLSTGRSRRPASRGSSPIPLTAAGAPLGGVGSASTTSAPFQSSPLASHSFDADEGAATGKDAPLLSATKSPRPSKRKASALSQEVFADTASTSEELQAAVLPSAEAAGGPENGAATSPSKKPRLAAPLPSTASPLSTSPILSATADAEGVDTLEGAAGYDSDVSATGRLSRATRTPKRFEGIQLRRSASRSSPVTATSSLPSAAVAE